MDAVRIHIYFLLLIAALAVTGCKSGEAAPVTPDTKTTTTSGTGTPAGANSIVGKWTNEEAQAQGATTEFEFVGDGKFVMTGSMKAPDAKEPINSKMEGTYTLKGDALTMHIVSMVASSADASLKSKLDEQNAAAKKALESVPDVVSKLSFKDGNTAVITTEPPKGATGGPQVVTLKRKS